MYIEGVLLESTAAVQVQMRMHPCIIRPAVLDSCCHQCLPNVESKYVILNSGCSSIMDGMPYMAPCSVHLLKLSPTCKSDGFGPACCGCDQTCSNLAGHCFPLANMADASHLTEG